MCAPPEQAERVCLRASERTGINTHTHKHTHGASSEGAKNSSFPLPRHEGVDVAWMSNRLHKHTTSQINKQSFIKGSVQ